MSAIATSATDTLSRLQSLGLRRLSEIEITDDARWPLASRGSDPQLCFGPPPPGAFRVTAEVEAEDGDPSPVLYLNTGHGYAADQALALTRAANGLWQAECVIERPCRGWRLDPLDRPGRFRVDRLVIEHLPHRAQTGPAWLRRARTQVRQALAPLRTRWDLRDLSPSADLFASGTDGTRFTASNNDPQFLLEGSLRPGWYMAEVQLALPAARTVARFYLDHGQGMQEEDATSLPLRSGQLSKRLIKLDHESRLRFDPMPAAGEFTVERFCLVRVTVAFARERLVRKLAARHPRYRDGAQAPNDLPTLWEDYNALFEQSGMGLVQYADWIREVEPGLVPDADTQRAVAATWAWQPRISVVMPTYNSNANQLQACLESVLAQTYPHWELCIADDASTAPHVRPLLEAAAARDARIRVTFRAANGHISQASNTALDMATGDFVALLDHDDVLAEHALFAVADALQQRPSAALLYSDEDKLDETGQRCEPFFKPGWSPDLLRSQNYFSHLGVYRRALVTAAGGFRAGYEGSQDHDLVLRCTALVKDPGDIVHIPQVLYHWRMAEGSTARSHGEKDYASDAGCRAVQDHLDTHHPGAVASVTAPGIYRHRWPLPEQAPLVSLIIPTRDGLALLRTCIESILSRTTYTAYEILVVDNQSTCPQTLAYMAALDAGTEGDGLVRVLRWDHPFNYSAINNFAAAQARGSVLGLINNDIEVISPDWLCELVSHAVRPDIGCVGAKLYYPDDTIQHAGVVTGLGGVANHAMRGTPREAPGYFGRLWTVYNPSAVTGAVLVLRREVFEAVGGLDAEGLAVAFNDVDLCLKVRATGLRNLWTPFAELYHHESVSRGADSTPEKRARFLGEVDVMLRRWGHVLPHDEAYSPHLTRLREDYSIAPSDEIVPHTNPSPA